jgi:hypothetical protein
MVEDPTPQGALTLLGSVCSVKDLWLGPDKSSWPLNCRICSA